MNRGHMEFCTSDAWRELLEDLILPGALGRVDLGPRVVEVGPGPGFTTDVLLRSVDQVTAVEIDSALVGQLRKRLAGSNVTIVEGDARATGLPTASFSGAASFHMLHHVASVADQDRIFAELFRLLVPGGTLLMADSFGNEEMKSFHVGDAYNPIDVATLPTRLGEAGFVGIEIEPNDVLGWYCTASVPFGEKARPNTA